MMFAGVRPTIRLASAPMASTRFDFASIATTEGSLMTMPRSRTWTSVFAVPRSMPMSREKRPSRRSNMIWCGSFLRERRVARPAGGVGRDGVGRGRGSIPGRLPRPVPSDFAALERPDGEREGPGDPRDRPDHEPERGRSECVERVSLGDIDALRGDDHSRRLEAVDDAAPQAVRREQPARGIAQRGEGVGVEDAGNASKDARPSRPTRTARRTPRRPRWPGCAC